VNAVAQAWTRLQRVDPRLLDGALAVALAVAADIQFLAQEPGNFQRMVPVTFTCLPLVLRRRYPMVGHALQVGAAVASQREPVTISLLAIYIGIYSVAVYSRWRRPFLIWLLIGAALLGRAFPFSSPSMPSWALLLVAGMGLWLAGNGVRDRQMRLDIVEERALRLERERELSARLARADERERIARELHDVVAHSVSVMVVQAGAARMQLGRNPDRAAEALLAVESGGRQALGELRHLLGLLTDADAEPSLTPQPGLDQLDQLVERVGQSGLAVDLQIEGSPRPLSPGMDLTAYRIVQEALTNALKYASGARTQVLVKFGQGELRLEVLDAGGARLDGANGAGRGLLGMRERVAIYGGELEAGQRPEGGFAVRARLPLEAA
jgi:signal transduction histidine kinase